jgi:hypothetical protein
MKKITLNQMEMVEGGSLGFQIGCRVGFIALGILTANPIIGMVGSMVLCNVTEAH